MQDQLYKIAAFYQFADCPDADAWAAQALAHGRAASGLLGTLIVAGEGINATLAGSEGILDGFVDFIRKDPRFASMAVKYAWAVQPPFGHFRVKRKQEIVTFRQPQADPRAQVGTYVEPEDWNALISRSDVTLIDTRNDYEVQVGRFQGAVNPRTDDFTAFAAYVQEHLQSLQSGPVAMYCTGGIRCEKATAYLRQHDVKEVYQLKGGILNYLGKIPPQEQLWEGECFVFDGRVAVDADLRPSQRWKMDHSSGRPIPDSTANPAGPVEIVPLNMGC